VGNGKAVVAAKKATLPLDLQIGQVGDPYTLEPLYTSAGGYLFGTTPGGGYNAADVGVGKSGSLRFARMLARYGQKGQGVLTTAVDPNNSVSLFTSGKSPYIVTGPWAIPQIKQAGIKYKISPVPSFAGMGPTRPFIDVQAFFVSSKAKNAAIAQQFLLDYVSTVSGQEALFKAEPRPPALITAYNAEASADPDIAALKNAAKYGQVLPAIPAMDAVWGPLGKAEAAIVSGANPVSTMTSAGKQIVQAIKQS
jgi:arabinogalactan oligomer/maltooligosaccharide transport system substrate-binding protein